jgi:hypothetical protein
VRKLRKTRGKKLATFRFYDRKLVPSKTVKIELKMYKSTYENFVKILVDHDVDFVALFRDNQ